MISDISNSGKLQMFSNKITFLIIYILTLCQLAGNYVIIQILERSSKLPMLGLKLRSQEY